MAPRRDYTSATGTKRAVLPIVATAALTGAQALNALLIAGWLGAEGRGAVTLAWSIASLLLLIGTLGLLNSARVVIASSTYSTNTLGFWRSSLPIMAFGVAFVCTIGVVLLWLIVGISDPSTIFVFAVYCGLLTCAAVSRESLNGEGKHVFAVLSDIVSAVLQLVCCFVAHHTIGLNVELVFVIAACAVGAQLIFAFALIDRTRPRSSFTGLQLARFSIPALGVSVGQWVAWKSDRILLGLVSTNSAVGVYATAATLADLSWLIATAAGPVLTRQLAATRDLALIRKFRVFGLLATILSAVGAFFIGFVILTEILPGEYSEGVSVLAVLCGSTVFLASARIDVASCVGLGDLKAGAKLTLTGGAVLVFLALPMGALYGALGCAIASCLTYVVMAVQSRYAVIRLVRAEIARKMG